MNLVTMQSFDDNIIQKSRDEIAYTNNCRMREYADAETLKQKKRFLQFCDDRAKNIEINKDTLSYREAIEGAILELWEAGDKFMVMYYNMPNVKYHITNNYSENKKWEDKEFVRSCAERANSSAKVLQVILSNIKD